MVGAGPPDSSSGTPREAARTVRDTEEGQASQPYIGTPLPEQAASNPPAVEAGLLPKLSSGLLSGSVTKHHNTFQQLRHPAETGWHEPHVIQQQKRKGKQRDRVVNKVQGNFLKEVAQEVRKETEEESSGTEITCPDQMQTDSDPFVETPA